jgi:Pyruvate/2-oxoacid:ferredoxin oxidoreductase gamma subunit
VTKQVQQLDHVTIRFAGDSGDGMQLAEDRFTQETAAFGNDLSTLPNFPAEIGAPAGALPDVSSFQLHFADHDILMPGDAPNVLIAMNPAALKANIKDLPRGGDLIVNTDEFTKRNLAKVGYDSNPLEDGSLEQYNVHAVPVTSMTVKALEAFDITREDAERAKSMFALGMLSWLYDRPAETTLSFLRAKFATKPEIMRANMAAFQAGWNFGETTEAFTVRYEVRPAPDSGPIAAASPTAGAASRTVRDEANREHPSVFISYSRPDSGIVEALVERLSAAGVNVSWDMDLPAGANFSEVLVDAIDRSDFVIAVVSPDYLASNWAQGELAAALSSHKRVLPIVVRPTAIDGPLQYIQFLDVISEPRLAGDKVIQLLTGAS